MRGYQPVRVTLWKVAVATAQGSHPKDGKIARQPVSDGVSKAAIFPGPGNDQDGFISKRAVKR